MLLQLSFLKVPHTTSQKLALLPPHLADGCVLASFLLGELLCFALPAEPIINSHGSLKKLQLNFLQNLNNHDLDD